MLNNMKIATRLSFGFGIVSFLLLVVMALGLQSLSSLRSGLAATNATINMPRGQRRIMLS